MSEEIPGYIFKIETYIKDLDDPLIWLKKFCNIRELELTKNLEMNIKKERMKANAKKIIFSFIMVFFLQQ